jgi:hypothetical protein
MSNPVREELQRFKKLFTNYGKVIVGGMILSGIFLFLYGGLRANYISIVVLTTMLSTITLSLVILLLYIRFHERRWMSQPEKRSRGDRDGVEEIRKLIVEAIAGLPSSRTKTPPRPTLGVSEPVLLSVFQWGHLIGKIFYCGLSMVKFESAFGKRPKEV